MEGRTSDDGALSPLKRRQLGSRIRQRREELGLKQLTVAQRIDRSVHWLSDLENGKLDPKLSDLFELADVLRLSVGRLLDDPGAGRDRRHEMARPRRLVAEEDDTERREFLLMLASLGLPLDLERMIALVGQRVAPDTGHLANMERVTDTFMGAWYTTSPVGLLPAVSAHAAALRALLPGPPGLRPAIASAAGWATLVLAHALLKVDRRGEALAQYLLADALAREAGDSRLHASVLACRSSLHSTVSLGDRDGDTRRALALLDEAVAGLGRHPSRPLAAGVLARRAEERAVTGDAEGALRDLEAAEIALAPSGDVAFSGPRDAAELGAVRGLVLGMLGQHRAAVQTLDATLAGMDPSLVAWRAAVLADQGAALAQQGDVDEACVRLHAALDLAQRSSAADHMHRVAGVRRVHLAAWTTAPAVRQLDERLGHLA